jgi:hypothetical protein
MKGVLPFLVRWACRADKRFLFCLGCSCRLNPKYLFPTVHYFNSFVPIAQQAGHWQAAVLGRLSIGLPHLYLLHVIISIRNRDCFQSQYNTNFKK